MWFHAATQKGVRPPHCGLGETPENREIHSALNHAKFSRHAKKLNVCHATLQREQGKLQPNKDRKGMPRNSPF
jgi:hypothetical protein